MKKSCFTFLLTIFCSCRLTSASFHPSVLIDEGSEAGSAVSTVSASFSDKTATTVESVLSEDSCKSVARPQETYLTLMKKFKLKRFHWNTVFDYSAAINPKGFAYLIAHNFIEAHFYGFNCEFRRRSSSDNLKPVDLFNNQILYDLIEDGAILHWIGGYNCLMIIKKIVKGFKACLQYKNQDNEFVYQSAAISLTDFLEFIVNELMPKYPLDPSHPEYNHLEHLQFETEGFVYVEYVVNAEMCAIFDEIEFLSVNLRRYQAIWPDYSVANWINDSMKYMNCSANPARFREVFTLFVKFVPGPFVRGNVMNQYMPLFDPRSNIRKFMRNMAPILRALILSCEESLERDFLEAYYRRVCDGNDQVPFLIANDEPLKVLNYFVLDSHFSVSTSSKMKLRKSNLIEKILGKFFKITPENFVSLACKCLSLNLLPLYEVILQHFGSNFSNEQCIYLFRSILSSCGTVNHILPLVISFGYLKFNDFDEVLCDLDLLSQKPADMRVFNAVNYEKKRSVYIDASELYLMFVNFPLKRETGILADAKGCNVIGWACSDDLIESFRLNPDDGCCPKLLHYAQALLCKFFKIPFYNCSFFENKDLEFCCWNEMIGFMNFAIEAMAQHFGLSEEVKLVRFEDWTRYKQDAEIQTDELEFEELHPEYVNSADIPDEDRVYY